MIRYSLICETGHEFDTWFRSSSDCDAQIERALLACPQCGSAKVAKALMAPSVQTARKRASVPDPEDNAPAPSVPAPVPAPQSAHAMPVAALPPEAAKVVAVLREIRDTVLKTSENVGDKFAEEARKIHFGETEERGIYGQATPDDVSELLEDGIEVMPLPVLPEDRN